MAGVETVGRPGLADGSLGGCWAEAASETAATNDSSEMDSGRIMDAVERLLCPEKQHRDADTMANSSGGGAEKNVGEEAVPVAMSQ